MLNQTLFCGLNCTILFSKNCSRKIPCNRISLCWNNVMYNFASSQEVNFCIHSISWLLQQWGEAAYRQPCYRCTKLSWRKEKTFQDFRKESVMTSKRTLRSRRQRLCELNTWFGAAGTNSTPSSHPQYPVLAVSLTKRKKMAPDRMFSTKFLTRNELLHALFFALTQIFTKPAFLLHFVFL